MSSQFQTAVVSPSPAILLYDWANTLVAGWSGFAAAVNVVFARFNLPLWSVDETRSWVRLSVRATFPVLCGADWEQARGVILEERRARHLQHVVPMPGAAEALTAGAPWPQGVVSNKVGSFLRAEVLHLGWSGYFGAVVGAGDAAADKPDPAPVLLALDRLGAAADRSVWYLGDTA